MLPMLMGLVDEIRPSGLPGLDSVQLGCPRKLESMVRISGLQPQYTPSGQIIIFHQPRFP